jgi:membrane-bound inhibitor of C-type lysozyme
MPKTTYHCPDGSLIEAWYPGTDTATIVYQGRSIEMTSAVSASGARYVGGSWEWWTKGMTEGTLAPLAEGESIATAGGMTCTAR